MCELRVCRRAEPARHQLLLNNLLLLTALGQTAKLLRSRSTLGELVRSGGPYLYKESSITCILSITYPVNSNR